MDNSITTEVVIPDELKEIKKLSRNLFESKVNELFFMSIEEMKENAAKPDASVIDIWLTKLVVNGAKAGDLKSLQFLLDRIIGPIKTQISAKQGFTDGNQNTHWVEYIETYGTDDFDED
jgi:hypothetical protein